MSQPTGEGTTATANDEFFTIPMMHHPCHHVVDLAASQAWIERVFGARGTNIGDVLAKLPRVRDDWPRDYSYYTPIRDVFLDTLDPKRIVLVGRQRYPDVDKPHLEDFGFAVDGMAGLFRRLKRNGIHATNSLLELAEGDDPPSGPNDPAPMYLLPEEVGRRYRFYPAGPFPADPRTQPGWTLPPVPQDDPLGLDCCSHHTVLTGQPDRALRLFHDILGGEIVHEGRDELRGTTSTYVHFAGSTLEFAVPDPGTEAYADWAGSAPEDSYYAITWKVVDLDRAQAHLEANDVRIAKRTNDAIITDPETSIGVPWGFSTSLVAGDPRANG